MIFVAVYRVNKNRGYTVMANFHLRDKSLSLKAVGLLSKMLSFNDGWKFSTKGLSAICKEGPDAILSALRELEKHGYLVRHRQRDGKGRMSSTIFEIYEEPQESTPEREIPHTENPCVEKPDVDNPRGDKSAQINTDQVITQERNTLSKNYQSINLDGMDRMDERSEYEEIIKENLDYDILCQDPKFDKDRFREIMDIMLDAVCSTAPTIRINGEDMPQQVVKSRFLKLNSSHIEYVLEAMNKNPSDIRNIRAYLLTALYNASLTIDNYYSALVNHDFYGQDRSAGSKKPKTYDYIIMLTALNGEDEQIRGLDLQVDDYITKPFSMPILVRKIGAVLRRSSMIPEQEHQTITYKNLVLDMDSYTAVVDDVSFDLTQREFEVLRELLLNQGRVLTRQNLLDKLWKYDFYGDERVVDTHIKNLRKKLGIDFIQTIRGVGYKIDKEN